VPYADGLVEKRSDVFGAGVDRRADAVAQLDPSPEGPPPPGWSRWGRPQWTMDRDGRGSPDPTPDPAA